MTTEEVLPIPGSSNGFQTPVQTTKNPNLGSETGSKTSVSGARGHPDFNAASPAKSNKRTQIESKEDNSSSFNHREINRNSLIWEDEILDFENSDLLPDDEESWLYEGPQSCDSSSGANEKQGSHSNSSCGGDSDVISWLRVAAHSLDSKSRSALIHKLDAIAAKKSLSPESDFGSCKSQQNEQHITTHSGSSKNAFSSKFHSSAQEQEELKKLDFTGLMEEEETGSSDEWFDASDGDHRETGFKTGLGRDDAGRNSLNRRNTYKVDKRGSGKKAPLSSATFSRKPSGRAVVLVSPHNEESDEISTPDFVKTENEFQQESANRNKSTIGSLDRPFPDRFRSEKMEKLAAGLIPPKLAIGSAGDGGRRSTEEFLGSFKDDESENLFLAGGGRTFRRNSAGGRESTEEERSREASPRGVHPQLHPKLQDIQLLASMQEEDLRQCLEKMQISRRRRTTDTAYSVDESVAPSRHQEAQNYLSDPTSGFGNTWTRPVASAPIGMSRPSFPPSSGGTSPSPYGGTWGVDVLAKESGKASSRYATYTKKPPSPNSSYNSGKSGPGSGTPRTPAARKISNGYSIGGPPRMTSTPIVEKQGVGNFRPYRRPEGRSSGYGVVRRKPEDKVEIQSQTGASLQKSLPNLAASRSCEFSLPENAGLQDSISEKGSYGDLLDLSDTATVAQVDNKNSSLTGGIGPASRLKQPQPRLSGAAKSGIPLPKSGIPKPRAKSPAGSKSPYAVKSVVQNGGSSNLLSRHYGGSGSSQVGGESWNEGCF